MSGCSVHRLIEQQAVFRPDDLAIDWGYGILTYRELNQKANGVARRLLLQGVRRGTTVAVKMRKSADAAVVLLAVLKTGAVYVWLDPMSDGRWPAGISIREDGVAEERWRCLDPQAVLAAATAGPNLPVLSRASDIACALPQGDGRDAVLVPHSTITTLSANSVPDLVRWGSDAGALELWLGLMSGATVQLESEPLPIAA